MVRYIINPPQDFKWTHKLRAQLPAGQAEGKFPGGEPDPVAWRETGASLRMVVRLFLVPTHGHLEMSVQRTTERSPKQTNNKIQTKERGVNL